MLLSSLHVSFIQFSLPMPYSIKLALSDLVSHLSLKFFVNDFAGICDYQTVLADYFLNGYW